MVEGPIFHFHDYFFITGITGCQFANVQTNIRHLERLSVLFYPDDFCHLKDLPTQKKTRGKPAQTTATDVNCRFLGWQKVPSVSMTLAKL